MTINYKIDGLDLYSEYGVRVQHAYGIFDIPGFKDVLKTELLDEHGEEPDLINPVMNAREIELECYMKADTLSEFIENRAAFEQAMTAPGLRQMVIEPGTETPIVCMVYLPEGLTGINKRMRDGEIFARFTMKLIEPEPVKIVGKLVVASTGERAAELNFSGMTSAIPLNIDWGDGVRTRVTVDDIYANTATYSYGANGTYYVVISGKTALLSVEATGHASFMIYPTSSW